MYLFAHYLSLRNTLFLDGLSTLVIRATYTNVDFLGCLWRLILILLDWNSLTDLSKWYIVCD